MRGWPGLRLTIGVSGWDEFNHTTTATAGFFFRPFNDTQVLVYSQFSVFFGVFSWGVYFVNFAVSYHFAKFAPVNQSHT